MELDVDTLLTQVYCLIDELYQREFAAHKPARPGPAPRFSDSEVLTLAVLAQWYAPRSERAFLAYVRAHWQAYFPHLLSQSRFNRRLRDLWGVLAALGPALSHHLQQTLDLSGAYQVLDCVPVPVLRRCRGLEGRCFADEVGIGHGGSDDDWYYGVQVLSVVDPQGLITGFVVGPANTEERWLAEALLRWRREPTASVATAQELAPVLGPSHKPQGQRRGPTGPIAPALAAGQPSCAPYLGDLGFQGTAWQAHWQQDYQAQVLTKAAYRPLPVAVRRAITHWLASHRQVIETVHADLVAQFGLPFPRARTYWGLLTRLAAKVVAHNLAIGLNLWRGRPRFAHLTPFIL